MIRYSIVKTEFPLAHAEFARWVREVKDDYCEMDDEYLHLGDYSLQPLNPINYRDRDLYDFFDSVGIVISVVPNKRWSYKIVMRSPTVGWTMVYACKENVADSRPMCEEFAFYEAFSVLNDIKNNKLINTKTKGNNEIIH